MKKKDIKVLVLLSTYNGDKHISELLYSIFSQKNISVDILIRDDGSSDETITIVKEFQERNPKNIRLIEGKNIGSCKSFISLIWLADFGYDYYAFADQDDIWLDNKLERAIKVLNQDEYYNWLYCGNVKLVDGELKDIDFDIYSSIIVKPGFGNALIENISKGCTMVFTKELLLYVRKYPQPKDILVHDLWLYQVATIKGHVVYDSKKTVLYRQENNLIGGPTGPMDRVLRQIKNAKTMSARVVKHAKLLKNYDLNMEQLCEVNLLIEKGFINSIKLFFEKKIYRQRKKETIIFKTIFMMTR